MNYIPFPRLDLDNHPDLMKWRAKNQKKAGDWKILKPYLHACSQVGNGVQTLPKCWFSELPQGDDYALDVEHFRPKNSGNALSARQVKQIEQYANITIRQSEISAPYPWLTLDYRNYRLVTATTNRAGGKHIYFPIAPATSRLPSGSFPWITDELCYFLDPSNKQDASLLFVKPNGEIAPIVPRTQPTQADYDSLPQSWRSDCFNYVRAVITIVMFNLNKPHFITGRKIVYEETRLLLLMLEKLLLENPNSELLKDFIKNLVSKILPASPFSLAAKSALIAYQVSIKNMHLETKIEFIIKEIIAACDKQVEGIAVSWNNP